MGQSTSATTEALRGKEYFDKGSFNEAAVHLKKAAELGDAESQNTLGYLYEHGKGIPKDLKRAESLYQKASAKGHVIATWNLSTLYSENPRTFSKSQHDILNLTKRAAKGGYGPALSELALMYLNGTGGVRVNQVKAKRLLEAAIAAGEVDMYTHLGLMYEIGQGGLSVDYEKARTCYEAAIEGCKDLGAMTYLAGLHEKGKGGLAQDPAKAAKILEEVFARGGAAKCPAAIGRLCKMYEKGVGVPKDMQRARELLEEACKQGYAPCQSYLGTMYLHGNDMYGYPQDLTKALNLLETAAEEGNTMVRINLGWMYHRGVGVEKTSVKALELYEEALAMGDTTACYNLGVLYYEGGEGVPRNVEKARLLWDKAEADNRLSPAAMFRLAERYLTGEHGMPKDVDKAKALFMRAASSGHSDAVAMKTTFEIIQSTPTVKKTLEDVDFDWTQIKLTEKNLLGRGTYGSVHRVELGNSSVAIKRVMAEEYEKEFTIMQQLDSPYLVPLYAVRSSPGESWLVMEFMELGDLQLLIKRHPSGLGAVIARKLAADILKGLEYMHSKGIIHRDLKPANIFLAIQDSSLPMAKIGDFGMAKFFAQQRVQRYQAPMTGVEETDMTGEVGTAAYMAPEVIKHEDYDHRADIFSFTLIFYEMLFGYKHHKLAGYEAMMAIVNNERPPIPEALTKCSAELSSMIKKGWHDSPDERPSCAAFLHQLSLEL